MINTEREYRFQSDWFSQNIPVWNKELAHLMGKPDLRVLEIGSFEGRSTVWILKNIATSPSASVTCIDTFGGSIEDQQMGIDSSNIEDAFRYNIEIARATDKVMVLKGKSSSRLKELKESEYDLVYIDGSHVAVDVLTDAVMAFQLLKEDGIMIFDDYYWDELPNPLHRPKRAIDAFLDIFQEQLKLVRKNEQVIIKKERQNPQRVSF